MCNRFRSVLNWDLVSPHCTSVEDIDIPYNPNVAPTNHVPIIRSSSADERILGIAAFGITPKWSPVGTKPPLLMNARVETIHTKRTFKNLYQKSRCVVPVEGYYEWRTENGHKQPYLFTRKDGQIMYLAGLWELDSNAATQAAENKFLIITGQPNSLASPIHDRMPCIVDDTDIAAWLDITQPGDEQLIIYPSDLMNIRHVNPVMNKASVKDIALIDQITSPNKLNFAA